MSEPYRLRALVPPARIEEFFVWLDKNCAGWTGYNDDDRYVSFVLTDVTAACRIARAWPIVSVEKIQIDHVFRQGK